MGFTAPYVRASENSIFDRGRYDVTHFATLHAERHGETWSGRVSVQRRTGWETADGDRAVRTCTAHFTFSARLKLEPELTPAPTRVAVAGDALLVTGSEAPDEIRVNFNPDTGMHLVNDPKGVEFETAPGCTQQGPTSVACSVAKPQVVVEGGSGDDVITVTAAGAAAVKIVAGGGDDVARSYALFTNYSLSPAAPARILGGGGRDVLSGTGADDVVHGGTGGDDISGHAGDDRLVGGGGRGADSVEGNEGNDELINRDGRIDGFAFCGSGHDVAVLDLNEPHDNCERVERPEDVRH